MGQKNDVDTRCIRDEGFYAYVTIALVGLTGIAGCGKTAAPGSSGSPTIRPDGWSQQVRPPIDPAKTAALLLLVLTLVPTSLFGQSLGFGAHLGTGTSPDVSDAVMMAGVEGELFARPRLVVSARSDVYDFGFVCIGLGGCPNHAKSLSLGALYRTPTSAPSFYLGGDVGRTWWRGDLQGWLARPRAGGDLRVVRHLYLKAEIAYTRFIHSVPADLREPADQVLGVSAGLRLRF